MVVELAGVAVAIVVASASAIPLQCAAGGDGVADDGEIESEQKTENTANQLIYR